MEKTKKAVTVAMSGGVDSTVCASLILDMGYSATGATMRLTASEKLKTVNSEDNPINHDIDDARAVCKALGIEHKVYELGEEFERQVIDDFVNTYISGGTPNPCVVCNKYLKFGRLLELSLSEGRELIATGHYANIERDTNGRYQLKKAADLSKDQTYMLWSLDQHKLSHTLLPLGKYKKSEIREIASEHGFVNAKKKDSQDICFIPNGDYAAFIRKYTGREFENGSFIDILGNKVGTHNGLINYTIGQRKGLGLAMGEPVYVKEKSLKDNTVTVCRDEDLFSKRIYVSGVNLIACDSLNNAVSAEVKIRYRHEPSKARIEMIGDDRMVIEFDEPQRAPTNGQSAVFYDGDTVIGGGIIEN